MKKTLVTDADLRARWSFRPGDPIRLEPGYVLTPGARDFVREHHIELVDAPAAGGYRPMTRQSVPMEGGKPTFVEAATGRTLREKPEEAGRAGALGALEEVYDRVQTILAAEVKDEALPALELFGLDEAGLRRASHQVKETLGMDHPIPQRSMGRLCLQLNLLRTQVREAELWAARAFAGGREDILRWLNRLSSGVYLIFCRELAGYYD